MDKTESKIVDNSNGDEQQAQGIATSNGYIPDKNTCRWNKAMENKH